LRWLALVLVIAAPVVILVTFTPAGLVWVAVLVVALMLASAGAARTALGTGGHKAVPAISPAGPPRHPFLIMNPMSGGGMVAKFRLKEEAEALGAEVVLLQGPDTADVAAWPAGRWPTALTCSGWPTGTGPRALVAGIAAEHGLPFLVISAGTRNRFALDLGLNRDDPATCLGALTSGGRTAGGPGH